jgi:hypothetical protein
MDVGAAGVAGALGVMLLSMHAGMRLRARHLSAAQGESTGFASVHGAVFALLGPMIAFTFSGAASRFDHRRDLIVEEAATQMHPPAVVWMMLGGLTLVCSFLVGYDLAGSVRRNWLHILTFALLFSLTLYVIIDMEYPRVGIIRVTAMDRVLETCAIPCASGAPVKGVDEHMPPALPHVFGR